MAKKNNKSNHRDIKYIKLAYEQAQINLGSTSSNPSVGCIVVKNDSVISSGCTSINGRPHAENNALRKELGENGRIYVNNHFNRNQIAKELKSCLQDLF